MNYSKYPRHDVLCIDIRSFYASVEAVMRGLDPMTALLAVVGDPNRSGSVVLAASPALKKKYGLKNVSRFFEIPKDKDIVIAPARMKSYLDVSVEITRMIYSIVPPEAVHVYSIDELWVTLNGTRKLYGSPLQAAHMIQDRILEQFGLTSAIGLGDNKFLAKVVMDIHAKQSPTGIVECRYEDVKRLLWPTPIEKIWGIGTKMEKKLHRLGIFKLGELANYPLEKLKYIYGVMGEQLYWHAWGIDLSPVIGDFVVQERKGYSNGITLLRDYEGHEISTVLLDLCDETCKRARKDGKAGRTIHLSIGYSIDMVGGGGFSRSMSIDAATNSTMKVHEICMTLFNKFYDGFSPVRRVSVSLSKIDDYYGQQLSLFDKKDNTTLERVMDDIKDKYGPAAILRASSYTKSGITLERSKKIGGHFA
ncbi:Y-family DNA polymerase [Gracilibacillus alcaliphilus]|uniref:Y-family DNA polymerase n=1 Tax=Gracilibacillus alcaliphilus TaxID=1401441 RepID=UPI0019591430|nr:UV damage repair protein UvrX [Gracilibacillus alcaliphilus]MBM7679745.1 DNA polymerase V [Gracilibacillus alcaliphilus]